MDFKNRVYYLDLLRALAITLVFVAHTIRSYGPSINTSPLQFGGTGVDLFFLLSGWLIGHQLFSEYNKFGNIDTVKFWTRRWMRTFPAYFAVLFMTLAQLYLTKDSVPSPLPYFTFTQNYFSPLPYFAVSWSLAVEEQFYLLIAPTIIVLSKLKSPKLQFTILLLLLITPSIFRFLGWYSSMEETHVRWDCCIMGIILAFMRHRLPTLWQQLTQYALPVCITGLLLYLSFYYFRWYPPTEQYVDPSKLILAFVFATLVLKAVTTPVPRLPYAHGVIMHISTRSYSIYLLHPDALAVCKRIIPDAHIALYFVVAAAISLIASEVLYRFIELPFIDWREKFKITSKRVAS